MSFLLEGFGAEAEIVLMPAVILVSGYIQRVFLMFGYVWNSFVCDEDLLASTKFFQQLFLWLQKFTYALRSVPLCKCCEMRCR